jgi:ubiquinone/menaquinone biosynthesis C-methylase UbiE
MQTKQTDVQHDVCPHWLSGLIDNPLRRLLHSPDALFAGLVNTGDTVLDLGCGPGTFTLDLARRVGPDGHVIAVDLQPLMLDRLRKKAERGGLLPRIRLHPCSAQSLKLEPDMLADFALAFWMVHEVPDPERFLRQVYEAVRPDGCLLLVEPEMHVSAQNFAHTVALANDQGWRTADARKVRISRAVLLQRAAKE